MEVYCFQLQPLHEQETTEMETWSDCPTSACLSALFRQQIEINESEFVELTARFEEDAYAQQLSMLREGGESEYNEYLRLRNTRRSPLFDAYTTLVTDLLPRDEAALLQDSFNVTVYAIVLTNMGEYAGHVYAWTSNESEGEGSDTLFAMGIRKRIADILYSIDNPNEQRQQIIPYLFEGIRLLALSLGKSTISVVQPYDHVARILQRAGFKEEQVSYGSIGISPATYDIIDNFDIVSDDTTNAYTSKSIIRPFYPDVRMNTHIILN